MLSNVHYQIALLGERRVAKRARERFLFGVHTGVGQHVAFLNKRSVTVRAAKLFIFVVYPIMNYEISTCVEGFFTLSTRERFLSSMLIRVDHQ